MKSDLLLYRITGDSAQLLDKLELGDYDDRYIFLAGVKDGTPSIHIFNWEDPSDITFDFSGVYQNSREYQYVRVYDLRGGFVLEKEISRGIIATDFSTSNWEPGVYIFSLSGKNGQISTEKVIVH
ncbi:MAG: T9SS type A sorting domain-containing protein [Bacteroidales bacterium]|nr:T9SS type A sorting domain-containing protein [Bacteroidales bacterium]